MKITGIEETRGACLPAPPSKREIIAATRQMVLDALLETTDQARKEGLRRLLLELEYFQQTMVITLIVGEPGAEEIYPLPNQEDTDGEK